MTTVLLVDDHRLVRAGLRAIIEAAGDLSVVGEAADGRDIVDVVRDLAPDVVLMDLSMPQVGGIEATTAMRSAGVDVPVVVLTSFAESEHVTAALSAGAVGYLLKDSEPADVVRAIRAAADGNAPIDPRVARALLPSATVQDGSAGLSAREREVLGLVVWAGLSYEQAAAALDVPVGTVRSRLSRARARLTKEPSDD